MKILIIGGGNMGLTFAQGFKDVEGIEVDEIIILEKSEERRSYLRDLNFATVISDPDDSVGHADLIILAVKPQISKDVFLELSSFVNPNQIVMSIMAGIDMASISEGLGLPKVVRAMPNLPAQIGEGMTVFTASSLLTEQEINMIKILLDATGKSIYVDEEKMINAGTAISGSGPAYIFYFMNALLESAVEMGFSQDQAKVLTYQTFRGATDVFAEQEYTCTEWMDMVTSKGGTTAAALNSMKDAGTAELFKKGVKQAFLRAEELSK